MTSNLATDLRAGYDQVAEVLAGSELELLARARDSINRTSAERNQLLGKIVAAYQRGPRQLWAPVILDLLAPAILESLQWLRPEPPVVDAEEVRQQLMFEVLRAAASIPIQTAGRKLKVRLLSQANRAVVRWLEEERVSRSWEQSFETFEARGEL
ncbi:MAG: hypothetical protein M3082_19650 [Candidatus Dormibacteraeota bacterium]|nr:hypothetical protein [Candidatus Dormibacteraeota bacterium]